MTADQPGDNGRMSSARMRLTMSTSGWTSTVKKQLNARHISRTGAAPIAPAQGVSPIFRAWLMQTSAALRPFRSIAFRSKDDSRRSFLLKSPALPLRCCNPLSRFFAQHPLLRGFAPKGNDVAGTRPPAALSNIFTCSNRAISSLTAARIDCISISVSLLSLGNYSGYYAIGHQSALTAVLLARRRIYRSGDVARGFREYY
jgi:hypothetical protein